MSYPAKWIRPCLLPLSTMVSFNYQLIYDWSLIKSGRRVDYVLPRNDISLKLVRFDVILFSVPSSIYPPVFPPTGSPIPSNPLPNVPDRCAAKFNIRQVSGSRETRRSIFRIGISTRRFTIRIHPFFDCPSPPRPPLLASPSSIPHVHVHTYQRSLSLYFSRERNEIGAIARFHLQSGTKLSMLNLIS